jgi:hypothetical protein
MLAKDVARILEPTNSRLSKLSFGYPLMVAHEEQGRHHVLGASSHGAGDGVSTLEREKQ